jgi:hypothetical protein
LNLTLHTPSPTFAPLLLFPTPTVLDQMLTPTQVDLIFAKVKGKSERRIKFAEFLRALEEIAQHK